MDRLSALHEHNSAAPHRLGAVADPFNPGLPNQQTPTWGTSLLMFALDALDYGLILISRSGRLHFANRVAMQKCLSNQWVRLVDGHVRAISEHDERVVRVAIDSAASGRRSMIKLGSDDGAVSIAVVPVSFDPDVEIGLGDRPTILWVFGRPQVCEPLSVEFFARECGMTLAETAVLRELCRGIKPAEVASRCGVAVSTVRTHISRLRVKTGATTIGEMVRMVTVLPPIVPVLN